jgi:hypothetical protein
MKKTAVLAFIFVAAAFPALAKHHHHHHHRDHASASIASSASHPHISCETVRAYVAQVGLAQAKALAQSAGMTEAEEREAAHCLEKKI